MKKQRLVISGKIVVCLTYTNFTFLKSLLYWFWAVPCHILRTMIIKRESNWLDSIKNHFLFLHTAKPSDPAKLLNLTIDPDPPVRGTVLKWDLEIDLSMWEITSVYLHARVSITVCDLHVISNLAIILLFLRWRGGQWSDWNQSAWWYYSLHPKRGSLSGSRKFVPSWAGETDHFSVNTYSKYSSQGKALKLYNCSYMHQ